MNKPIIFLDFDGLKFDTLITHTLYVNDRYGINSKPIDYINNPGIHEVIKKYYSSGGREFITEEEVYEDLAKNFHMSSQWSDKVSPIEGMVEAVSKLYKKYILWTVTARQSRYIEQTNKLLEKYVPGCISGIHFVYTNLGPEEQEVVSKREFILSFPGEKVAFIDDSTKEIEQTQDIIPSYLFDPFGFNDYRHNIRHRVRSWKEIEETFM